MRNCDEVREQLALVESDDARGSYEELAGAAAALRWVLGEEVTPAEIPLKAYVLVREDPFEPDGATEVICASLSREATERAMVENQERVSSANPAGVVGIFEVVETEWLTREAS